MKEIKKTQSKYKTVLCFDAVHDTIIDRKRYWLTEPHTWRIPDDFEENIYIGDIVKVETRGGIDFVKVVSVIYAKSKEKHAEEIHPHCWLIKKCYYDED